MIISYSLDEMLDIDKIINRKTYIQKYYIINKEKIKLRTKQYRLNNPDKYKEYNKKNQKTRRINKPKIIKSQHLKSNYGITIGDYERMLAEQNNKCYICKKENKYKRKLHVDHDHNTNKIRKLLCAKCNFLLGVYETDISILYKFISYIEEHQ